MTYKALYLKYRPQTFKEVAGQKPIVRTLENAFKTGKISHAYLFAGPRGTGKTSMARLFAKALNCEHGVGEQCQSCSNCEAITNGTHPDVIEVDAASNNGVDQIRELIDGVRYSPIKGRYKIYIIDEVHMMSTGAFNALLKTLEEPPEDVVFILCTTEPHKVLPTILSRCLRFDFAKLTDDEMGGKLKEILEAENVTHNKEAIDEIISLADGGMRDALSILDQVLAYSGNTLKAEDVLAVYGLASKKEKIAMLQAIGASEIATVLSISDEFIAKGYDIKRLVQDTLAILKDALIYEKTGQAQLLAYLNENEARSLTEILNDEAINACIKTFLEAQNNFKMVSDIRSLFELSLLELTCKFSKPVTKPISKTPMEPEPTKQTEPEPEPTPAVKPLFDKKPEETKPKTPLTPTQIETSIEPAKTENTPQNPPKQEAHEAIPSTSSPDVVPDWLWDDKNEETDAAAPITAPTPEPIPESKSIPPAPPVEPKPQTQATPASSPRLDLSRIEHSKLSLEGDSFSLEPSDIINIMVLGEKAKRKNLLERMKLLSTYRDDPTYGDLVSLLLAGAPYCICDEALILVYTHKAQAKKVNLVANQTPMQELIECLIGQRVFVYAVDNGTKVDIQANYYSLMQSNLLPNKKNIQLHLPK